VATLLFRLLLTPAEAAVLLNRVDEEQGQPPADVVFQGLQNCKRDLISPCLATMATGLWSVMTLFFRLFLTSAEAAVLLNRVDEEQRQPPADVVFQGLQNC
jgi:ABC-type thiamine transport system substrate-binding protein